MAYVNRPCSGGPANFEICVIMFKPLSKNSPNTQKHEIRKYLKSRRFDIICAFSGGRWGGGILCLGFRAGVILLAISSIMPCYLCGRWMGPPGVPPWAFPVVPAWPHDLVAAPNGCWLWSERCGGWICLCTLVCYRKWCIADIIHRARWAGG